MAPGSGLGGGLGVWRAAAATLTGAWPVALSSAVDWDEDRGFLLEGGKPPHIQWLRPRRVIRPGVPEAHLTSDPAHSTPRDPLTLSEALHAAVAGGPRS